MKLHRKNNQENTIKIRYVCRYPSIIEVIFYLVQIWASTETFSKSTGKAISAFYELSHNIPELKRTRMSLSHIKFTTMIDIMRIQNGNCHENWTFIHCCFMSECCLLGNKKINISMFIANTGWYTYLFTSASRSHSQFLFSID